ncbi:hypothetical protein [Denitrobaculum tricleocarpae]|uniref:Uncharacterized protein n=1 Tax=Denitrobaculum tricleocarpae TaxID=2591009 RepID=A0A545TKC6_9PROT|nr:hypothetical protein [Denitrobaculum tricleocarpae]TQV77679.1 hypothetical protein FKG95_19125 [Denitrobaculum tricleocarpae]
MQLILGPLSRSRGFFSTGLAVLLIALLTLISQVGGVVLWLAYGLGETLAGRYRRSRGLLTMAAFIAVYSVASFLLLPALAPAFGRIALNCFADSRHAYAANSPLYCILNRHYVTPGTKEVLEALSDHMARKHPGTVVSYLDGGFPLPLGIPLLPHLSHNDGRKLDLAFFYKDKTSGKAMPKGGAWFVGYWAFAPAWDLLNTSPGSQRDGALRWRMNWLQWLFADDELDRTRTADMVRFLTQGPASGQVQRLFLEPYLKPVLKLRSPKIGFAGWNAARHDDHLHFQVY